MGGKGITTVYAMAEVDRKSLEHLEPLINSVYSKLNLGLDEQKSWERFIGESGSNLIYKYMNIFRDSVELGGSPDKIGQIIGSSMLEQVLLREKRDMLSKGFIVLLIPMHAAMAGIFLFLFYILLLMSKAITAVMTQYAETGSALSGTSSSGMSSMGGMNLFVNFPEAQMTTYVVIILLMITVSNTLAGKIVAGGDRYMLYFFASLLCIITGMLYILAPVIVGGFFTMPGMGLT
jgi:flagellar protein FlaJ